MCKYKIPGTSNEMLSSCSNRTSEPEYQDFQRCVDGLKDLLALPPLLLDTPVLKKVVNKSLI
jgi:hypothetical protein